MELSKTIGHPLYQTGHGFNQAWVNQAWSDGIKSTQIIVTVLLQKKKKNWIESWGNNQPSPKKWTSKDVDNFFKKVAHVKSVRILQIKRNWRGITIKCNT